jgi:hypothetical protein
VKKKKKIAKVTCRTPNQPPNVDHATVRSSTPSRTGEKKKKKIAKVTCRTPNQPPKDLQKNIENGRGRWRHSRSNKKKKNGNPSPDKRKLRNTSDRESLTTQTRNC